MTTGVMHPPLYTLFGLCKPHTEVTGFVKPGYEGAREAFEQLMEGGMEENVQVGKQCIRQASRDDMLCF
jgi:hypothetical protein